PHTRSGWWNDWDDQSWYRVARQRQPTSARAGSRHSDKRPNWEDGRCAGELQSIPQPAIPDQPAIPANRRRLIAAILGRPGPGCRGTGSRQRTLFQRSGLLWSTASRTQEADVLAVLVRMIRHPSTFSS